MLSIIIPAYNAATTLEACLRAVRVSTYPDYELIVVDDGSSDGTVQIARKYADKVLEFKKNLGQVEARKAGWTEAKGDVVVNIDSDVVIRPDTLKIIADYFNHNPPADAITGMVSRECPFANFSSQYKNFYMHYIFSLLPEKVSFLYGSIFAVRKNRIDEFQSPVSVADDTALGQHLAQRGGEIVFLKNLEITHLKQFTLGSLFKNDFRIPYDWALLFMQHNGLKQLFRNKTGFAHASRGQLISVMLAPALVIAIVLKLVNLPITCIALGLWLLLNLKFFLFLTREKGLWFGVRALFFTFLDHLVMATGIFCGFTAYFSK